jgi:LysM repeat protein
MQIKRPKARQPRIVPAFKGTGAALSLSLILALGTAQAADTGPRAHAQGKYDTASATYLVVEGDDLFAISERFEVPMDALKAHNKMTSSDVKIGQKLKIGGTAIHNEATKKPVSKMTCEDFLVLDESFQPEAVSMAVAYGTNGKPEAEAIAVEGVETVTPYIVEECKKAPKESFWKKAKAEYKKMF